MELSLGIFNSLHINIATNINATFPIEIAISGEDKKHIFFALTKKETLILAKALEFTALESRKE